MKSVNGYRSQNEYNVCACIDNDRTLYNVATRAVEETLEFYKKWVSTHPDKGFAFVTPDNVARRAFRSFIEDAGIIGLRRDGATFTKSAVKTWLLGEATELIKQHNALMEQTRLSDSPTKI